MPTEPFRAVRRTRCQNHTMTGDDTSTPASHPPAPPGRTRRPGRPKAGSEDKHERILNEAVILFGSHGYSGTSLAHVADAAEISKAGLLHHFSSKEALFAQVLERRDRRDEESILNVSRIEDPWELLDAFVELVEYNTHQRDLVAIYTATAAAVLDADHPAHAWMARHLASTIAMFEVALERGKRDGTVHPDAPSRLIARTLTALSDGLQIQWLCSTTSGGAGGAPVATGMVEEVRLMVDALKAQWRLPGPAASGQAP